MYDFYIKSKDDLVKAVREYGIVPFFRNEIPSFSIAEHVDSRYWFSDDIDGVWEWKGPVIRETGCAYGKLFRNKAVFMTKELYTEFSNYRRDGYDFDARTDDGLTSFREQKLYGLIKNNEPVLSKTVKIEGNYSTKGEKGFDSTVTSLQMQCYVLTSDFVYNYDKHGKRYGWGTAEYSTPEKFLGEEYTKNLYRHTSAESYGIIFDWIRRLFPSVRDDLIHKLIK